MADTPLVVVDKINGTDVSWALGSMIYNVNSLSYIFNPPSAITNFFLNSAFAIGFWVLLLVEIVVAVIVIIIRKVRGNRPNSSGDFN